LKSHSASPSGAEKYLINLPVKAGIVKMTEGLAAAHNQLIWRCHHCETGFMEAQLAAKKGLGITLDALTGLNN
jgi:hypothetical protein